MSRYLKPDGPKVTGWAEEINEQLIAVRLDMVRFMKERRVDPLEYHEFMWAILGRLEEANTIAKNIKESKYEKNGEDG